MNEPLHPSSLPEPDITAPERILARLQNGRRRRRWAPLVGGGALAAAGVAAVVVAQWPSDEPQHVEITGSAPALTQWSETVAIATEGLGSLDGTERELQVAWETGTLRAEVTPHSGTNVAIHTEEALVEVVGTVFSVTRDLLGTTVSVERGTVRVTCHNSAPELVTADRNATCLPRTGAGLLGRAEALLEANAPADTLLATLDEGIAVAQDDAVLGELLVRRMEQSAESGHVDSALNDAETYLGLGESPRTTQVLRFAGWLALEEQGCEAAMPWLRQLHEQHSGPETVLLAECVSSEDPALAGQIVQAALPGLDATWSDRGMALLGQLDAM